MTLIVMIFYDFERGTRMTRIFMTFYDVKAEKCRA